MMNNAVNAAYTSRRRSVRVALDPLLFHLNPLYNDIYQMNYITVDMIHPCLLSKRNSMR
jgi:hypothetical protein